MSTTRRFIIPFGSLTIRDIPIVGGKNASLGEMVRTLSAKGVKVPNGFAVTAQAYRLFFRETGLSRLVPKLMKGLDTSNMKQLTMVGESVRRAVRRAPLPAALQRAVVSQYRKLSLSYKTKNLSVAVPSSATAEDLPDASFAGQQETYLNVVGEAALLDAVRKAYASLFTNRAISYRVDKGFAKKDVALSVGVQAMVRSDRGASGVLFTIDTESGFRDNVIINAIWGLGENIVQGAANPDEFVVFKPTLRTGARAIISKKLGAKQWRMVYGKKGTRNIKVSEKDRMRFSLSDKDVLTLSRWGMIIEEHYGKPMDIEWAKDGITGELFIVQARPETVMARRNLNVLETYHMGQSAERRKSAIALTGIAVGNKVGSGKVRVIKSIAGIREFQKGEVLVTTMTDPDWEPIMKIASAIVTDSGGRTAHAAIVSRELGIPAVVGTGTGTKVLKTGQMVTVSCAEGEQGVVYRGAIPFTVTKVNLKHLKTPKTQMMMIVGEPDQAFHFAATPNQGVGLARLEFIISNYVRIHPLALVHYQICRTNAQSSRSQK